MTDTYKNLEQVSIEKYLTNINNFIKIIIEESKSTW
jgi:hypothetical protein